MILTATRPALAQSPPVLVSEDKAYFFGERDPIVTGSVLSTSVSSNGRHLLAIRASPRGEKFSSILPPPDPTQATTIALTLYDARRNRATDVWKIVSSGPPTTLPIGTFWLSENETAVLPLIRPKQAVPTDNAGKPIGPGEQPPAGVTLSLLYVNTLRATVRELTVGATSDGFPRYDVSPSPTRNEALVALATDAESYALRFLTGTGMLQPAVSVPARSLTVKGWSADGNRAEIRASVVNKENKREFVSYVWERQTRTLRRVATTDKDMTYNADDEETDTKRREGLPVQMRSSQAVITAAETKREANSVIVGGRDGKASYLLATDAKPISLLESGTRLTAVYETDSALYAVPVYPVTYSEYVTFLRRGVESSAKQIDSAIEQWLYDNKVESLPASFDPIAELVGDGKTRYLKRDAPFRDPKSGAMIFKNVYTGKPDGTGNIARFTLQSPFGKLTMYEGGRNPIVWDPVEPPAKP